MTDEVAAAAPPTYEQIVAENARLRAAYTALQHAILMKDSEIASLRRFRPAGRDPKAISKFQRPLQRSRP